MRGIENEARVDRLSALSKAFDGAGLARTDAALREVRAVPTIFPQVDQVLGVGGWPIDRFGLVHGESGAGKTEFVLGLMLSFLLRGHAAFFVDAERSTPIGWVRKLLREQASNALFRAVHPDSYEGVVDDVEAWATAIGNAKEHGKVPADTTGICVVDSIRKLTPKRLLEKMLKELAEAEEDDQKKGGFRRPHGGIDGAGGRANQIKAAINAQWVDRLTSLLHQTGTALVVIAREYEVDAPSGPKTIGAGFNFEAPVKVGGGTSLYFESSVVARVTEAGAAHDDLKRIVSERHRVQIRKTKIAGKLVRYPDAHFWTSSGVLTPYGFDAARDLLELGEQLGSVTLAGAWYSAGGEKIGNGKDAAVKRLAEDLALFAKVDLETRRMFMPEGSEAPAPLHRKKAAPSSNGKKAAKKAAAPKKGKGQ